MILARLFLSDFLRVYRVLPVRLKRGVIVVLAYISIQAILEILSMMAITSLAVSITRPDHLQEILRTSAVSKFFPRLGELSTDLRQLSFLGSLGAALVIVAKNAMFALVTHATVRLGESIALFAGEEIFRNFLRSPYIVHLSGDSHKMFQAINWRDQLATMIVQLLSIYTYMVITIALILTVVIFIPFVITIVLLCISALAFVIYMLLKNGMEKSGKNSFETDRETGKVTMNAMSGIREAIIYRQQDVFFNKFHSASLSGLRDKTFLRMAPPIPTWILETVGFMSIPVTMWIMFVAQDASMARITAVLTMMMLVCWRLLPLLNRSVGALVGVRGLRHAAMDCLGLLEAVLASPLPEPADPAPDFALRQSIGFIGVSFHYPKAESDSLHNLNFSIPCGAKVGIIGPSGAGKSSIAAILSGLVEPTAGVMLVDDRKLFPPQQAAYCAKVGYVPQSPYILDGSIAENVSFSQWGKEWDEEKVLKVCHMAELDIVNQYGIDYTLKTGGIGLSGGQIQRLAIARALYANPSLLILDESTSSLDSGVEAAIMNTIFSLPQSMTIVIIAHRLSTVERCDTLFWIDAGTLKAEGAPEEILPSYQAALDSMAKRSSAHSGTVNE